MPHMHASRSPFGGSPCVGSYLKKSRPRQHIEQLRTQRRLREPQALQRVHSLHEVEQLFRGTRGRWRKPSLWCAPLLASRIATLHACRSCGCGHTWRWNVEGAARPRHDAWPDSHCEGAPIVWRKSRPPQSPPPSARQERRPRPRLLWAAGSGDLSSRGHCFGVRGAERLQGDACCRACSLAPGTTLLWLPLPPLLLRCHPEPSVSISNLALLRLDFGRTHLAFDAFVLHHQPRAHHRSDRCGPAQQQR